MYTLGSLLPLLYVSTLSWNLVCSGKISPSKGMSRMTPGSKETEQHKNPFRTRNWAATSTASTWGSDSSIFFHNNGFTNFATNTGGVTHNLDFSNSTYPLSLTSSQHGGLNVSSTTAVVPIDSPPPPIEIEKPVSKYSLVQRIFIAWIACCLALLTVLGNILVMISFKIDKQLQTISNYFLFSLAVADFLIGTIGMPLATVYLLMGYWPFGVTICDTWLSVDYLTSNASVLNLLIISFDRYFSVTRPLTYR